MLAEVPARTKPWRRGQTGDNHAMTPPPNAAAHAPAALHRIGWRGELPPLPPGRLLARVAAQHRAGYEVHDGERTFNAQPAPRFLKRNLDPAERPAVGDFVAVEAGAPPHIVEVLPRRSVLRRAAAGERYARQIIATNIDLVLVLTGLDGDFNPARIERYLALIEGSGAHALVVLSKADQFDARHQRAALHELAARLPQGTPVHAIDARDAQSAAVLAPYLTPGITAALVGSSGAGKSTLTNTLLGEARMATGETRARDDRGRHTTTHRALLPLPGGACLIDTPGMRELKLTGDEALDLFADIDELAAQCRFADCAHGSEPGCAVRAALDAGELDPARWRQYRKLHDERDAQITRLEERLRGGRDPLRTHRHRDRFDRE